MDVIEAQNKLDEEMAELSFWLCSAKDELDELKEQTN